MRAETRRSATAVLVPTAAFVLTLALVLAADLGLSPLAGPGAQPPSAPLSARPLSCGSLQARIDATPASGTLDLTGCDYTLRATAAVSRSVTIRGGSLTASVGALLVTASGVTITGMTLRGPGSSADNEHYAIEVAGSSASAYLSDITVTGNSIAGWDGEAIHASFVDGFAFSGNDISDIYYAGIGGYSVRNGRITGNHVRRISGTGNAYGIYLSRAYGTLSVSPRSADVEVSGNVVEDIPHWEGLDTHGGQRIRFVDNTVRRVRNPVMVGASVESSGGPSRWAPLDVVVIGNTIESGVSDGSMDAAIYFQGASADDNASGSSTELARGGVILGNTITGYGNESNGDSSAIQIRDTIGLQIRDNTIIEASPSAISPYVNNYDFTVTGNVIRDPWSDSRDFAYGIYVHVDYNSGVISGNTFQRGTKVATSVLTQDVQVSAYAHNNVIIR